MIDSGCYPPGADTPYAPWNEQEVPERQFYVCISQTLSKSTEVTTDDYVPEVDQDEDGYHNYSDISDTNWGKAYREEHYTPLDLIQVLSEKCKQELKELEELGSDVASYYYNQKKRELEHLIDECSCWAEDETEVVED